MGVCNSSFSICVFEKISMNEFILVFGCSIDIIKEFVYVMVVVVIVGE